ncbi:alpha/beta fold hydrolase [Propionivibrio sp.]|uniref:esterase/lipase family protein n=1 Tax=Propionivibrio sp. TaxID=2212460 RepID=UPI002636E322|nr:alpha/beta fold hydrolase [Propionivibrio sp.]
MLAIILRLFILFELVCYATIALYFFELTALAAGVFAVAGVFAARLWRVGLIYAYGRAYRSPAPSLGWWRASVMFFAEYVAFITNFVFISPFERWWMGADRLLPCYGRPPLLLIHGYGCSRAAWWSLRRRLEAAGWSVATINLEPLFTSIENFVEPVARRLDDVLAETGATQVVLVGHSMGGLVAHAYLRRHGVAQVSRLVTLGTPHAGSELAKTGIGENARQMRPGSAWLTALASEAPLIDTLNIFSRHDNFVLPQVNLVLPGAQQRIIDGLGHLAMLYSPRVAQAVLDGLPPLCKIVVE